MEWIINQLRERPELAIFLTLFLGFWLGKLRIGKFSLGTVTSVLLVGVSKGVLTETMTTENGASLSQSEVHLEVLKNLISKDADNLRDIINFQLIPKMIKHGFPLRGYRFDWYEGIDFTPEQQVEYERLILDKYVVDPQYFIDKYNVPIIGEREAAPVVVPGANNNDDDKKDKKDKGKQKLVKPFFD